MNLRTLPLATLLILPPAAARSSAPPLPSPSPAPRSGLADDPAALARLKEALADFRRLSLCSPACLATLEEVHALHPAEPQVVELLRTVYQQRKDWPALILLEEERPSSQRSVEDRTRLALWYFREGRYREAAALLEALLAEKPGDAAVTRLAGLTFFQVGEDERASPLLDATQARLSGTEAAEAATARALIHFRKGEVEAAEAALGRALQADPDYVPAHSALVRVLTAKGDERGAREHLEQATALRARSTARESQALRLGGLSQTASRAAQERRWDEVERLVAEMLPLADVRARIRLYRFLGEVRQAAGRTAAAEEAFRTAEELAGHQPPP